MNNERFVVLQREVSNIYYVYDREYSQPKGMAVCIYFETIQSAFEVAELLNKEWEKFLHGSVCRPQ